MRRLLLRVSLVAAIGVAFAAFGACTIPDLPNGVAAGGEGGTEAGGSDGPSGDTAVDGSDGGSDGSKSDASPDADAGPPLIAALDQGATSISLWPYDALGDTAPLRTITTGLLGPYGLASDRVRRELVATNTGDPPSIVTYSVEGSAPLRTITGATTTLDVTAGKPKGVAVDDVHGEIFVVLQGADAIAVWPRTADGDIAPVRVIQGATTTLKFANAFGGSIAVDPTHDEIFVTTNDMRILTFARTDAGDVAPRRIISGAFSFMGVAYAPAPDEILVNANNNSILAFARTDEGFIGPKRTLTGSTANINGNAVVFHSQTDELVAVGGLTGKSIGFWPRTAPPSTAPSRSIVGSGVGSSITGLADF